MSQSPGASQPVAVRRAVREYAERWPAFAEAAAAAVEVVRGILDDAGLNYLSVTGRAKSPASFRAKAGRSVNGTRLYPDPMHDLTDVIGLRVVTFVRSDVAAVADLLGDHCDVLDDRDLGRETASEGRFGYASRHLQVLLRQPTHPELVDRQVQVQIRTVLQHAWAEFEHDIRYKGSIPEEQRADFDRRFTLAAGLLELADQEFATIRARLTGDLAGDLTGISTEPTDAEADADVEHEGEPRLPARELAAYLAGQYPDAAWSREDHYNWIAGLLPDLGIGSYQELGAVIGSVDDADIAGRLGYRHPPGAVRRLDDALLLSFGERYLALPGNAHRRGLLEDRLAKMR